MTGLKAGMAAPAGAAPRVKLNAMWVAGSELTPQRMVGGVAALAAMAGTLRPWRSGSPVSHTQSPEPPADELSL